MIAVRGLALQGVAKSPTIMLTHCPVRETQKRWLCLGRFNHSLFGYYWLCLFCATADCLPKYSRVIIVWGMCSPTMETTTSDRHLLISVIINARLWRSTFDGSKRLIFKVLIPLVLTVALVITWHGTNFIHHVTAYMVIICKHLKWQARSYLLNINPSAWTSNISKPYTKYCCCWLFISSGKYAVSLGK